jgi:hypothetical protein
MWSRVGVEIVWTALWCVWIVSNIVTIGFQRKQTAEPLDTGHLATLARATQHIWTGCNGPPAPALTEHLALLFSDAPYSYAGLLSRNPTPAVQWLGNRASVHGRSTWFLFFAVSSNITPSYIYVVQSDVGCPLPVTNMCCFRMILNWFVGVFAKLRKATVSSTILYRKYHNIV